MKSTAFLALVLVSLAPNARADVLRVPADFSTIQAAVDAAGPGDVIQIGRGVWAENVLVDAKSGLSLVGKGRALIDPNGSGAGLTIRDSQNIGVSKLRIANTGLDGLVVENSVDVQVTKCRLEAIGRDGIHTEGSARITLVKNRIRGTGGDCISLAAGPGLVTTDDSAVMKNKLADCGLDGVRVDGSRNTVSANKADAPGNDGFRLDGTGLGTGNRFEKNRVRFAGNDGISIGLGATNNTFASNKALDTFEDGLDISANRNHFERNKLVRSGDDGVEIVGTDSVFLANTVVRAGDDGFDLKAGGSNRFERNKVVRATNSGFRIASGGNTFISNKAGGSGKSDLSDLAFPSLNVYEANKFKTQEILSAP